MANSCKRGYNVMILNELSMKELPGFGRKNSFDQVDFATSSSSLSYYYY